MSERKPNFLVGEKSPYLLQHAYNPVQWRPWGDEALRKAKNDSKPIFLSIGYSTCHWCHVLAHESFEDEETAAIINKNFIPIKVDREERPDLDAYYMDAVQAMTGGGGWPLSVFLTPDLRPFYGGTYYPPEPRYGIPSFRQVLDFVARIWKERRTEALGIAQQVTSALEEMQKKGEEGKLSKELIVEGYNALASSFDAQNGGFGMAPKFPLPLSVSFMLRHHFRTGKELALTAAAETLNAMMAGGIRDHLGGGFHRYSTDRLWLVPHFEKMLYDNALLAKVYLEAFQATGNQEYARVTRETLDWILGEMKAEGGGFYSAQDADTKEGEGVYYTWTPAEVVEVLGKEAGEAVCHLYGVTRAGNFEGGRSILHVVRPSEEGAKGLGEWRERLYQARLRRPRPAVDEKVLTEWNGLAISAFAFAGASLSEKRYVDAANGAADFILSTCTKDGRLLRRFAGGEAGIPGTLEDYACFVQGLLDLFEATFDPRRLEEAVRLTGMMVDSFADEESGAFYMSTESQPARIKEGYDGPTPSGNSVAAMNLLRVSELTGENEPREIAGRTLRYFRRQLEEEPGGHAYMMAALDLLLNGMREVVITGPDRKATSAMVAERTRRYVPDSVLLVATPENYKRLARATQLLEGRKPGAKAVAYVCENFTCKVPTQSAEELGAQLATVEH